MLCYKCSGETQGKEDFQQLHSNLWMKSFLGPFENLLRFKNLFQGLLLISDWCFFSMRYCSENLKVQLYLGCTHKMWLLSLWWMRHKAAVLPACQFWPAHAQVESHNPRTSGLGRPGAGPTLTRKLLQWLTISCMLDLLLGRPNSAFPAHGRFLCGPHPSGAGVQPADKLDPRSVLSVIWH